MQLVRSTPLARKIAHLKGVDLQKIIGSGPGKRILKKDVLAAVNNPSSSDTNIASQDAQQARFDSFASQPVNERVKPSGIRKATAKVMMKTHTQMASSTLMDEIDVTELVKVRKNFNSRLASQNKKLSFLPFIIKASAIALAKHPALNAFYDEKTSEIVLRKNYHIGIGADTPRGLLVPVIKDANQKTLLEIGSDLVKLAKKARDGSIKIPEMTGSTFTITNYGSVGAYSGIPIMNFPEIAILGIGSIVPRLAFNVHREVVEKQILPLAISFDHQWIDGADAARFLQELKKLLTDPVNMLLDLI